MTETCNGYFDSYYGDKPKKKGGTDDVYHPVYPEVKTSKPESTQAAKAEANNAQQK